MMRPTKHGDDERRGGQDSRDLGSPRRSANRRPRAEADALNGDPNFMTSLARGVAVIVAFSAQRRTQTTSQISRKTGISRAAVRRCLYTLEKLGYVREDGGRYSLQPQILRLGHAYLAAGFATKAQPYLDRVTAATHESCSICVLDSDEIVYLARSSASRIMSINLLVGSRLPAYCTSMGRVLLANQPAPQLEAYLTRVKLVSLTPKTVTSVSALRRILATVRAQDFSLVDQELEIGLRSIAVPVRDITGNVVASMNVGAQAALLSAQQMKEVVLPHLLSAAQELSSLLKP